MRFLRTMREPEVLTSEAVEELMKRLPALCAERGVVLLYLHGSYARGQQGVLSDLDFAALLESSESLDDELGLLDALQRASGREDVDVVFLNRAGPIIKDRVVRHGRLAYQRSDAERIRFEEKAIKEYLDFRYFSKQYDDALFDALGKGHLLG